MSNAYRGAATIRLHLPPPLETDFKIVANDDGSVAMYDGDTLVGSGAATDFEIDCPPASSLQQAIEAHQRSPLFNEHHCPSVLSAAPSAPLKMAYACTRDRLLTGVCWPLGREGRKGWAATAIANQAGEVLAYSRSLSIELKK